MLISALYVFTLLLTFTVHGETIVFTRDRLYYANGRYTCASASQHLVVSRKRVL